jgi:hypothetical protein
LRSMRQSVDGDYSIHSLRALIFKGNIIYICYKQTAESRTHEKIVTVAHDYSRWIHWTSLIEKRDIFDIFSERKQHGRMPVDLSKHRPAFADSKLHEMLTAGSC